MSIERKRCERPGCGNAPPVGSLVHGRWCLPCAVVLGQVGVCNTPTARQAIPEAAGARKQPRHRNPFHVAHTEYFLEQGPFW